MGSFIATAGAFEQIDDQGVYVVVIAEDEFGNGRRLEVQLAIEFDERDKSLGMDTYCLSTETGSSHYGGVTAWSINGNVLRVALEAKAASSLGLGSTLEIQLDMEPEKIKAVVSGLVKVLGSSEWLGTPKTPS